MKFNEMQYMRININYLQKQFEVLFEQFSSSNSFNRMHEIFLEINKKRNTVETMMNLVRIRYSQDTTNGFYLKENEYIDEIAPLYEEIINKYYKLLLSSNYRSELESKYGKQLFTLAELQLKTFNFIIIDDLMRENKLVSEYSKLAASARIIMDGKELNMSQVGAYLSDENRNIRKVARDAVTDFYVKNESEFDRIYDELVKVRTKISHKLGYENFVQLGYDRYSRSDYNSKMVSDFREKVLEHIVPLANELHERQANRLGLEKLTFLDEPLLFLSGNAKPIGDPEWIVKQGAKVFKNLSSETDEFYSFMVENELLDLVARKGKSGGGYCEYLSEFNSPFIFSNFNGTSGDIDILTHESGHAFQVYQSRDNIIPEYNWPTYEACEVHSTSMEYFTWPNMDKFFGDDADKYRFTHLSSAISFIPYGITVDEFQHFVYENPETSPKDRKLKWREIEKKYSPLRDYEDNDFLNRGGAFFRQMHIFAIPFYYIEYSLAKICAFNFLVKSQSNKTRAWSDYIKLCKAGGSHSFLDLLKLSNLKNPFETNTVEEVIAPLKIWLENINDINL